MPKTLIVVARIRAQAGKEEQVREALTSLIEPTHAEAGCLQYDLHRSDEDPTLFLFFEEWTSRAALDEHLQLPHLQELGAKAADLFDGPIDITTWEKVG